MNEQNFSDNPDSGKTDRIPPLFSGGENPASSDPENMDPEQLLFTIRELSNRLRLLSAQRELLEKQVESNAASIRFNFRTITTMLVIFIIGSFWLQNGINRLSAAQEAEQGGSRIAVYNPDIMELKLRESGLSLEECEPFILKRMGDEYQTRGITLLYSTAAVSYPEILSPDYRKYADSCQASLSNAQAVQEINEARALRENRGLSPVQEEEPETDYWGNPINEEPAPAPEKKTPENSSSHEEWNVSEKPERFVTEGVVVGVEEK